MAFCTFTLFNVYPGHKMAALRAFVALRRTLHATTGVRFSKVMGSGRGAVFSLLPDWSRWAFLIEWESAAAALAFRDNAYWIALHRAGRAQHLHLHPYKHKGLWDKQRPFLPPDVAVSNHLPVAVLTRASINPRRIPGFVRHSYKTSHAIENAQGLLLSLGMGEIPLLRQATLSVWASASDMERYAYADPVHREAMKRKQQYSWFLEEMFVRFYVVSQSADWAELCGA